MPSNASTNASRVVASSTNVASSRPSSSSRPSTSRATVSQTTQARVSTRSQSMGAAGTVHTRMASKKSTLFIPPRPSKDSTVRKSKKKTIPTQESAS